MSSESLQNFRYNGARALVLLHEKYMISCVKTWQEAEGLNIRLPETDDKDYQSLNTLLYHIFRASRGYMTWICEKLDLHDPEIDNIPDPAVIASEADAYLLHLLEKWRLPLAGIPEKRFHTPTYPSRWGVDYCIDAMLEHAVMHPIRHEFQLRNMVSGSK